MKRFGLIITCLVLVVAFTQGSTQAKHADLDFSGKWVFNASKSTDIPAHMPAFRVFNKTVTQNQLLDQLTIKTDFVLGRFTPDPKNPIGYLPITIREATFDLDGKETKVVADGSGPAAVLSAKWIGQDLELTQQITSSYNGRESGRKVTELWQLVENGKMLKIHQTIETGRTKQSSVFAFDKN
jgi:hypothetical protein